jgi:hypothetical protein
MSLAWAGDFSPYENCLKRIVFTPMADFPYGEKIKRYSEKMFHLTGTQNAQSGEAYSF